MGKYLPQWDLCLKLYAVALQDKPFGTRCRSMVSFNSGFFTSWQRTSSVRSIRGWVDLDTVAKRKFLSLSGIWARSSSPWPFTFTSRENGSKVTTGGHSILVSISFGAHDQIRVLVLSINLQFCRCGPSSLRRWWACQLSKVMVNNTFEVYFILI
jgi:hypothetical protein